METKYTAPVRKYLESIEKEKREREKKIKAAMKKYKNPLYNVDLRRPCVNPAHNWRFRQRTRIHAHDLCADCYHRAWNMINVGLIKDWETLKADYSVLFGVPPAPGERPASNVLETKSEGIKLYIPLGLSPVERHREKAKQIEYALMRAEARANARAERRIK